MDPSHRYFYLIKNKPCVVNLIFQATGSLKKLMLVRSDGRLQRTLYSSSMMHIGMAKRLSTLGLVVSLYLTPRPWQNASLRLWSRAEYVLFFPKDGRIDSMSKLEIQMSWRNLYLPKFILYNQSRMIGYFNALMQHVTTEAPGPLVLVCEVGVLILLRRCPETDISTM